MRRNELSKTPIPVPTKRLTDPEHILRAAIASLELGWGQGSLWLDKKGQSADVTDKIHGCCLWGAVSWHADVRAGRIGTSWPTLNALMFFIKRDYHHHSVAEFNDAPGRTKAEVLDVARNALKRIQEQEARR